MTTAQLRIAAREAEQNLNWKLAADLYEQAVSVYPTKTGALAALDIKNLSERARGCRQMVAA